MSHFKTIAKLTFSLLLISLLSCGGPHDQDEKYFLISTNVKIPYWQAGGLDSSRPHSNSRCVPSSPVPTPMTPKRNSSHSARRYKRRPAEF